jgi:hypothetical protein
VEIKATGNARLEKTHIIYMDEQEPNIRRNVNVSSIDFMDFDMESVTKVM